ncbi:MAG: TAXI family TRAP transporter solute-binding subunit [Marinosulfonomonas sp.]|nr:TAXI family TRAP transporter solute-binding subunit [Marinosulfonomonas sp.]
MTSLFKKALFGAAITAGLGAGAAMAKDLVMGSTSPTSSHFTITVAMSKAIEKGFPGANTTVIETGASVDNVLRLARDEIDLGLATGGILIQAREGIGKFEGNAVPDTVALYPYSASVLLTAVRADSGVKSFSDLAGKKFSPGIRGSAAESLISKAMGDFGIDVDLVHGTVGDAVEGIKNRHLVGYSKYGAGSSIDATLQELMTSTEMRLIGFNAEEEAEILATSKGVGFTTLAADLVPGSGEVRAPKVNVFFLTRVAVMDDDTAYNIAKAVHENIDILIEAWPKMASYDMAADAMATMDGGIAYHPGAARYWKEAAGK